MVYAEISTELLGCRSYREFLKRAFQHLKQTQPRFSHGAFAKRAGFSSRNYLRDIIAGQKRLTLTAFPKVCRGLKLAGEWKKTLYLLTAFEEESFNPERLSHEQILEKLKRSRVRIQKRVIDGKRDGALTFFETEWLPVYAALGSVESGASLHQILARTGLSESVCRDAIGKMSERQLVRYDANARRYFPGALHYVFNSMGQDEFFKKSFLQTSKRALKVADDSFSLQDRLFFSSTFSLDRSRLPDFRVSLRELLLRFVDSAENAEGSSVAELSLSFLPL